MLDLMEVPVGTVFYMSAPALGCVAMRVTDRAGAILSVEYVGGTTAGTELMRVGPASRPTITITPDLCERSFSDRDECRAYTAKRKLAKMYQDAEQARDAYLQAKAHAEKAISKVLEQNADLISKFPEMFL